MAVWQTPAQRNDLERQVKNLTEAAGDKVQRPMNSNGTFVMTDGGWINTTSENWKQQVFKTPPVPWLCQWGSVNIHYESDPEETVTAMRKKGYSHLNIYFGRDSLPNRFRLATSGFHAEKNQWATASDGKDIFITLFACKNYLTEELNLIQLNTGMFEVNPKLYGNDASINENTHEYLPANADTTYYTGWVETPLLYYSDSTASNSVQAELWTMHLTDGRYGENSTEREYIDKRAYALIIYQNTNIINTSTTLQLANFTVHGAQSVGELGLITIRDGTTMQLLARASDIKTISSRDSYETSVKPGYTVQFQNESGPLNFIINESDAVTQFQLQYKTTIQGSSDSSSTKRYGYIPYFYWVFSEMRTPQTKGYLLHPPGYNRAALSTSRLKFRGQRLYIPVNQSAVANSYNIEGIKGLYQFNGFIPQQDMVDEQYIPSNELFYFPYTQAFHIKQSSSGVKWFRVWMPQLIQMQRDRDTQLLNILQPQFFERVLWHKQWEVFVLQFTDEKGAAAYAGTPPENTEIVTGYAPIGIFSMEIFDSRKFTGEDIPESKRKKSIHFGVIDESDCVTDSEMTQLCATFGDTEKRYASLQHTSQSFTTPGTSCEYDALELFGFNDPDNVTSLDAGGEVLVRQTADDFVYLSYAPLSDLQGVAANVDTIYTANKENKRKSIDKLTVRESDPATGEDREITYLELYGFKDRRPKLPVEYSQTDAEELSGYSDIAFPARTLTATANTDEAKIQYADAAEILNTAGDHNYANVFQRDDQQAFKCHSLNTQFQYAGETKRYVGELYNFHNISQDATPRTTEEVSSLQFLAKDVTDRHDLILKYIDLKNLLNDYKGPWWYDKENNCFQNRYVQYGNEIVEVAQTTVTQPGNYWVHVTHPLQGQRTITVVNGNGGTSDGDNSWFLVATLTGQAGNLVQTFGIYAYPVVFLYLT